MIKPLSTNFKNLFHRKSNSLQLWVARALGVATRPFEMESKWRGKKPQLLKLWSAEAFAGKEFRKNGAARLLWCSFDYEGGHSRYSTVFGASVVAEQRTLWIERLSSDLSIFGCSWWSKISSFRSVEKSLTNISFNSSATNNWIAMQTRPV